MNNGMGFSFSLGWALFIVYAKITIRMPWPLKQFLISQFPDELNAQSLVLSRRR